MSRKTLLIELGTEELPPKSLKKLGSAFQDSLRNSIMDAGLIENLAGENKHYDKVYGLTEKEGLLATPRRLTFLAEDVQATQPDQDVERKGPSVQAAFEEDGSPTPAVLGFAKSCGVNVEELERRKTEKGEWLFFNQTVVGKNITDIVQEALDTAIKSLPIAKRMRWGNKEVEFVRPVHWLVVMHGDSILPIKMLGLTAGNQTQGHRFHCQKALVIKNADHYEDILKKQGNVIANYVKRRNVIAEQIKALAKTVGGEIANHGDLLDEVCSLVEYPNAILGSIDDQFMSVPQEALISSMCVHQKYFPIVDKDGKLLPYFITISNIKSSNEARVREGNERVLRARLSDAEFFWETDKKLELEDHLPALENVTYHAKLGSMAKKVTRLERLARKIVPLINADMETRGVQADVEKTARAARLAKADLTSNMVGEFSDLQGIMGKYYAQNDGEDIVVATAIEQHYWPNWSLSEDSEAPYAHEFSLEARTVALTDKLDSLVGIYGAGEIPTGDKDPYALRRAALGIICILSEYSHDLSLTELVALSSQIYAEQGIEISHETQENIVHFIQSRYKPYFQKREFDTNLINATSASSMDKPANFYSRLKALNVFIVDENEANDLVAANKRIANILKKADDSDLKGDIDTSLFEEKTEKNLSKALNSVEKDINKLFKDHQYEEGLKQLATLRDPIDAFFDNVMVMSENDAIKTNRLRLLQKLRSLFLQVADISLI